MKPIVYVVEDEKLALDYMSAIVAQLCPAMEVIPFQEGAAAMEALHDHVPDIAFLDIELGDQNGLLVAKKIREQNPKANIILTTGYSQFMPEAFEIHASAYLLKPVTEEMVQKALRNLIWPVKEEPKKILVRTFGRFEAFVDGSPLPFQYYKTKELFAYLIDAHGRWCTMEELLDVLWSEEGGRHRHESYLRNLISDLRSTLKKNGMENVLFRKKGQVAINTGMLECDYYNLLQNGSQASFQGEYMSQYSWSEMTLGNLVKRYRKF